VVEEARGTELAVLANEVEQAYADVFADRFRNGEDATAIVADVLANPTGGFSPAADAYEGFVFTPAAGPPLLFQAPLPYDEHQRVAGRGTDVLAIRVVEVIGGRITVYVYAGYYS